MNPQDGYPTKETNSGGCNSAMDKCFNGPPKKLQIRGAIMLVVGLILAIGVFLVGKTLPRMITSKLKDHLCIDSPEHQGYLNWLGDEKNRPSSQQFRVYYWNITNKDGVLYRGEIPVVKQRGPYIYLFGSSKHDVHFNNDIKTYKYKSVTQIEYDPKQTMQLCPDCKENDLITVPNLAYIAIMKTVNGDTNFALGLLPTAVGVLLNTADAITGSRNGTLTSFGKNESVVPANSLIFPNGWGPSEFGNWLFQESNKKGGELEGVIQKINRTSFTLKEMTALYDLLINPVAFGSGVPPSTLSYCQSMPNRTDCGFLFYLGMSNARAAALVASGESAKLSSDPLLTTLNSNMQQLLCPNTENSCLTLTADILKAVGLYITDHMIRFAMYLGIDSQGYGPIITKTQKDLVSGFVMSKLKIPPLYPDGIPVQGFLQNDTDKVKAIEKASFNEVFNCDSSEGEFVWYKYKNSTHVASSAFPGASNSFLEVKSHSTLVGFGKSINPCKATQSPNKESYLVFQPQFSQKALFVHKRDSTYMDVHVNEFELDNMYLFSPNNVSVFVKGLINMEGVSGGVPLLFSMPHFYWADSKFPQRFNMMPNYKEHQTIYKYEPISGAPVEGQQGFQVNTVMPDFAVRCPRYPAFNFTYTENMKSKNYENIIPIYWVKAYVFATEDRLSTVKQVYSVLQGSCACMVVGPLVGILLIFFGSFCLYKSCKQGRVVEELNRIQR